ncbi:hypothetical protein VTK56DRAFT_6713 [Thermocarpiscus australiensis]
MANYVQPPLTSVVGMSGCRGLRAASHPRPAQNASPLFFRLRLRTIQPRTASPLRAAGGPVPRPVPVLSWGEAPGPEAMVHIGRGSGTVASKAVIHSTVEVTCLRVVLDKQTTKPSMCNWEETEYACGHVKRDRMPYSCTVYTRHIYGRCKFEKRGLVSKVISYDYCEECSKLYEFVNLQ